MGWFHFFLHKNGCFNKHPLQHGFFGVPKICWEKTSWNLRCFNPGANCSDQTADWSHLNGGYFNIFQSLVSSAFQVYSVVCQNQCSFCCFFSCTGVCVCESIFSRKRRKKQQHAFFFGYIQTPCALHKLCDSAIFFRGLKWPLSDAKVGEKRRTSQGFGRWTKSTRRQAPENQMGKIWVFPTIGVPPNGWFIMENPY